MKNPLVALLSAPIRFYQRRISPHFPRRCRYEPTCSQYAAESLQIHGAFKGTLLAVWRFIRCNQFSAGGVDWVPLRGQWPTKPLGYQELLARRAREETSAGQRGHGVEGNNK
ncbi:membrane protein insertion efficiency factor YidD [Arcanobacterium canis]